MGAVIIAGNVTDLKRWGPAMAVMMLTVLYGYVIKAVLRMVLIARIEGNYDVFFNRSERPDIYRRRLLWP